MGKMNVAQEVHIVPVYWGANKATGVVAAFINMKLYNAVEFIIGFGTQGTADYAFQMQASAATAGSSSTDVAYSYRKTVAAGTDTLGDRTEVAAGATVTAAYTTDSGMSWIVDVDPAVLTAAKPYVGFYLTRGSSATAQINIIALCWPKYPQATNSGALT